MRLTTLLAAVESETSASAPVGAGASDPEVHRVVHDSRKTAPGDLFCCVPGRVHDGHAHAGLAVEAGAVAVLAERPLDLDVPVVLVDSVRRRMPHIAAAVSGHPSRHLDVVGVTGTNGKTSVVHLLAGVLGQVGRVPGSIGTLTGDLTTPEAPDLQRRLVAWLGEGRDSVVMEVSSHALDQQRVDGTRFFASAFTNFSRDHLDHHGTMEAYAAAKARLFTREFTDRAVVNVDDVAGRRQAEMATAAGLDVIEVSTVDMPAEVGIQRVRFTWRGLDVEVPVGGRFTVANAVMAAELAMMLGVQPTAVVAGLGAVAPVPGRFEPVDVGGGVVVVVDYAHTPDAMVQVLATARQMVDGARVIVVFGCGGDRDRGKRPLMGAAAQAGADLVVVTSDNPRGEPPEGVIEDILSGMDRAGVHVEVDRRAAIGAALDLAEPGDLIVIAGRGHETVQQIGGRRLPFDDRIVVAEEARRRPSRDGEAPSGGVGA